MSEKQLTAEERSEEFKKRLGENVKELNIDFSLYPQFVPDGQGGFKTVVQAQLVDTLKKEEPVPFVAPE